MGRGCSIRHKFVLTMEEKQAQKAESVAAVARQDTGKAKGAKVVPINANPQ